MKFHPAIFFLSRANDYRELMVIVTAWSKIYSTEIQVWLDRAKSLSSENYRLYGIHVQCIYPQPRVYTLAPTMVVLPIYSYSFLPGCI